MQKEIENVELVHGSNFQKIDSLKTGTKYLLIFDHSCEEICNSEAFVDFAGKHRWLGTIYIRHNLFHQSKLFTRCWAPKYTRCFLQISPGGDESQHA